MERVYTLYKSKTVKIIRSTASNRSYRIQQVMKVQSYSIIIIVYLQLEHSHTSGMIVSIPIHTYNDTIAGIAHTKSYPSHNILALNIHKIDARLDVFFS